MTSAYVLGAFDWSLFFDRLFTPDSVFARALLATIYISVLAQIGGVILGLGSALAGRSRFRAVRFLNGMYVTVVRGTPVIVQAFFLYFGLPLLLGVDLFPREIDIAGFAVSGAILSGIVALAINEGAYMSEIIRAGISSVDEGQLESGMSLGMTHNQAMRKIVLPQAARIIVPPLGNEFNNMMKTTSLLSFAGVSEMFLDTQTRVSQDFQSQVHLAAVACWYLLLTVLWTITQSWIERRLDPAGQADKGPGIWNRLFTINRREPVPAAIGDKR